MKKLIYCAAALVTALFAGSCQRELLDPAQDGSTVTFTVSLPEVATKGGIGDASMINNLVYAVYRTEADDETSAAKALGNNPTPIYTVNPKADKGETLFVGGKAHVSIELIKNQKYIILFWAQNEQTWVSGKNFNLTNVTYPVHTEENPRKANDNKYEAFCGVSYINNVKQSAKNSVTLVRPFAQINLATNNPNQGYAVEIEKSSVIIADAPESFNVATKTASVKTTTVEYAKNTKPSDDFKGYHHYVAMNYIFANPVGENSNTVKVTCKIDTKAHGTDIETIVENVPVAQNYKTNIVGNLLTSNVDYNVELAPWANDEYNSNVICDGLVKNDNNDYEVTNESGLAYAINKLFAQGGDFYLAPDVYEMAGYNVNPPTVESGVALNIYGHLPEVTTKTLISENVTGVTIKGLQSSIIETNKGTVAFSGITVEGTGENDETPAFIATNNGTADFTGCKTTTQDYIGTNTGTITEANNTTPEGNDIVDKDNGTSLTKVSTGEELVAALAKNNDVIFTNDIEFAGTESNAYGKTGINIKNGQTIDGNRKTLKVTGCNGTWDSVISTTGGLIKNLTVTGGFRGIFVNHNSKYSETVVLENVTIVGPTYTISCDQGMNQNLVAIDCTINGWTSYAGTIGEVTFTGCSFGMGAGYKFARPYAPTTFVNCNFCEEYKIDARESVTFKNCTLNGVALTDENLATLVTGNTANAGADTVVSTADELVDALTKGKNVFLANDITVAATDGGYNKAGILQNNTQTIDGGGHTLTVTGANATWDCAIYTNGGTIKNLTVAGAMRGIFTAGTSADLKIENVTFKNVIYTFNSDGGSKEYGIYVSNSTLNGWTSHSDVHKEVVYTNCSFGKGSGYAFCRPYGPTTYENCEFVAGYQIDPQPQAAVTFKNCTLNGVALTAETLPTLVTASNISKATLITSEGEVKFASTATELAKAVAAGQNVALVRDLTINNDEGITAPYGNKTALSQNGGVFNGNGKTITADLPGDNYVYMTNGGTTKNVNITGAFRGIMVMSATQTVYLDNVVSGGNGVVYAFNTGEGDSTQDLVATNCTFNGWSSWSLLKSATFTNCKFGQGSEYSNVTGRLLKPYVNTVFDGCDFCSKCYIDLSSLLAKQMVTIKNCTVNDVKITAENWTSLVAPEDKCGEGQISVELKNGTYLTAENVADYIVFE